MIKTLQNPHSFIKATWLLRGLYLAHFSYCVADTNSQFIGPVRKFSVTATLSDTWPKMSDFRWDARVRKICDTTVSSFFPGGLFPGAWCVDFTYANEKFMWKVKAQWGKVDLIFIIWSKWYQEMQKSQLWATDAL